MKIDAIDVYHVSMPLVYPFRTAFGNDEHVESILVRMTSDGVCGWGESSPWSRPGYSAEYAGGAFLIIEQLLAPALIGQTLDSGEDLQARLANFKGNPFAKAALDTAWWDLHARQRGEPLWQTLGGKRDTVEVGADFGIMETIDGLLDTIATAVAAGFKRVKLKYRPGWDLDMIRAVRRAFPDEVIHIDCNSAYTLADMAMFEQLDQYNLAMIEQPLSHDDLIDHATLQKRLNTPICLDESITSPAKARKAIEIGACRWVNIKPGRVGGLTPAMAIHDVCEQAGIPCWVGGMLESAVGGNICLALATLANFKYPADVFPSDRFYRPDLSQPPLTLAAPSQMQAHHQSGIGVTPHPDRLREQSLQHAHFGK